MTENLLCQSSCFADIDAKFAIEKWNQLMSSGGPKIACMQQFGPSKIMQVNEPSNHYEKNANKKISKFPKPYRHQANPKLFACFHYRFVYVPKTIICSGMFLKTLLKYTLFRAIVYNFSSGTVDQQASACLSC